MSELTIEEKLKALNMLNDETVQTAVAKKDSKKNSVPKVESLQQMLTQAIHSKDVHLLEEVLNVQDQKVITQTVLKLEPKFVMPLLDQIVVRFQQRPSRANALSRWIRIVMITHMSLIMANPELLSKIAPLYQQIEQRLLNQSQLVRLQGRLEVLDHQIKIRSAAAEQFGTNGQSMQPEMTYHDDGKWQSSDEDDDQDEEDDYLVEDEQVEMAGSVHSESDDFSDFEK